MSEFIPDDDDGKESDEEADEEADVADTIEARPVEPDEDREEEGSVTESESETEPGVLARGAERLGTVADNLRERELDKKAVTIATAPPWRYIGATAVLLTVVVGALGLTYYLAGPVGLVVYSILFVLGAGGVPGLIYALGPSMPALLGKPLGRGMFVLQQMSMGTGYLVEFDREYRMCPGREGEVYAEGEWREVNGLENMTVAGWQPFGTVRYKDEETLEEVRVDSVAADGGRPSAAKIATMSAGDVVAKPGTRDSSRDKRGGYEGASKPTNPHGWVLDLVKVYSSGLRKLADIASIEKSEEVAMREQAKEGVTGGNQALIGSIVGLIMGAITAYLIMGM